MTPVAEPPLLPIYCPLPYDYLFPNNQRRLKRLDIPQVFHLCRHVICIPVQSKPVHICPLIKLYRFSQPLELGSWSDLAPGLVWSHVYIHRGCRLKFWLGQKTDLMFICNYNQLYRDDRLRRIHSMLITRFLWGSS